MAYIDRNGIKLALMTQKGSRDAIGAILDRKAEEIVERNKEELIQKFISNPVSVEIEEGPNASNISDTLDGKGNLFTFIGFPIGEKPIQKVVEFIEKEINLDKESRIQGRNSSGRFKAAGDKILFDYKINGIDKDKLEQITPLFWEPTKSWLYGIEQGISGFTSYIYWKAAGRSTHGLQANDGRNPKTGRFTGKGNPIKLREGRFENVPYWSAMYNDFKKQFKGTHAV